ncbi:MAG: Uma2 family endonuclease [Hormoscilla sp. GUM202]|nr:Uma2 family endonuclease [Hormoscilla sp. GUM202]
MAESDATRKYLVYGVEALQQYFRHRSDVYVSGNLWVSYEEGVPEAAVCPDVFVVFEVEKRQRETYRVWEENGKTPDWVLEVTSSITQQEDEQDKPEIYSLIGVKEYFQYDPTGDYLNPLLKGRRLVDSRYQDMIPSRLFDGTVVFDSAVLGLKMQLLPDGRLRFLVPSGGEYLLTPGESERERVRERERANYEKERADRLAAKLIELGIDPDL